MEVYKTSMGDADASGKDFLLDAVAQFLQSSVWLDAVSAFLKSNFRLFLSDDDTERVRAERKVAEYSLAQYEAFTAFKDVVERLLEQLMADLGCSGEDLVAVLEDSVRRGQSLAGERRFFVKTLLSFDDYDAFCDKMTQYAAEKRGNLRLVCTMAVGGHGGAANVELHAKPVSKRFGRRLQRCVCRIHRVEAARSHCAVDSRCKGTALHVSACSWAGFRETYWAKPLTSMSIHSDVHPG